MNVDNDEMTHDDIWDDSVLVDSWNEALEEYKKYHSIHARGGKVEDILADSSAPSRQRDAKPETGKGEEPIEGEELGALEQGYETAARDEGVHASKDRGEEGRTDERQQGTSEDQDAVRGGVPPQLLLQSVRDEGLKKLLMSWYYAGYYTGLYEGQQKEHREPQ